MRVGSEMCIRESLRTGQDAWVEEVDEEDVGDDRATAPRVLVVEVEPREGDVEAQGHEHVEERGDRDHHAEHAVVALGHERREERQHERREELLHGAPGAVDHGVLEEQRVGVALRLGAGGRASTREQVRDGSYRRGAPRSLGSCSASASAAASCSAASGDEPRRRARVMTSPTLSPAVCSSMSGCGRRSWGAPPLAPGQLRRPAPARPRRSSSPARPTTARCGAAAASVAASTQPPGPTVRASGWAGHSTRASASARRPRAAASPKPSPTFSPPYRLMRPAPSGAATSTRAPACASPRATLAYAGPSPATKMVAPTISTPICRRPSGASYK